MRGVSRFYNHCVRALLLAMVASAGCFFAGSASHASPAGRADASAVESLSEESPSPSAKSVDVGLVDLQKTLVKETAAVALSLRFMSDGADFRAFGAQSAISGQMNLGCGVAVDYAANGALSMTDNLDSSVLLGTEIGLRLGPESESWMVRPAISATIDPASGRVQYQAFLNLSL